VHARIETEVINGITLVPRDAIIDGGIFVVGSKAGEDGKPTAVAQRREVTIGRTYQGFVEITAGLQPGEQVVLTNLDILTSGTRIDVTLTQDIREELSREPVPALEILEQEE